MSRDDADARSMGFRSSDDAAEWQRQNAAPAPQPQGGIGNALRAARAQVTGVGSRTTAEMVGMIDGALAALYAHPPAPQPSADPWRDAVEQMLAITEQVASDDPRKSIHRLIDWYVSVALDPLVSSDARALVQRGRDEVATQPSAEPIDLTIERLRDALVASRIILPEAVEDPDGYDDGLTLFRIEGLHRRLAGAQPSALKLEQPK